MYTRTQGCSLAVVFALVAAHASASPQSPVPTPIVEVGAAWLRHIAYSADGGLLAALTDEGLELLDADTYETVAWVGRGGRSGSEVGFSPDGSEMAVFGNGTAWSVYDATTMGLKEEHLADASAYAISPDWRRVAYVEGPFVRVWDRDEQAVVGSLSPDPEPFPPAPDTGESPRTQHSEKLAFHPDGVRLLVASYRAKVALWDTSSGEVVEEYDIGTGVQRIDVHPDGSEFAVHTSDGRTLGWRFGDSEPRPLNTIIRAPTFSTLRYGAEGAYLWSAGHGLVHRLTLEDNTEATGQALASPSQPIVSTSGVTVRPGHNQVASRAAGGIAIWSADSLEFERLIDRAWGVGQTFDAAYAPRRGEVITFDRAGRRWRVSDGSLVHTYEFPENVRGVQASVDGETAVAEMLGEARVFDTATGDVLFAVPHVGNARPKYAMSPSGLFIVTWTHSRATVWSVASGEQVVTVDTPNVGVRPFAFTPDDRGLVLLNTIREDVLRVWDIYTDTVQATVPGGPFAATERGVIQAFLPNDGSTNGLLEMRLVGQETPLSAIKPPVGVPRTFVYRDIAIDPSGRFVMMREEYFEEPRVRTRIHSVDTGAVLREVPFHPPIRFAADGEHLFAPGHNGSRALYRTEEFLGIVVTDVSARGKLLTPWGDVKRTRMLPNYPN
ncbi:WD40 repeat domain-containing protein, partial [Candidatus Poribacteria bacterium]|nr:WD40 repeat domain-containing protein [Candidatus Poribacteria bacterium]MBT7808159.1 WD40 repeat domain-containing protein [Candidatus Poribacteria bacterium]